MANRLADARSTYLRQHAENPVEWFPWGPEAFARARALDRPLLLSVGYAACHWCHVMAHESFEDPEIAGLINAAFVAVKVDRQEHPEVDAIYQLVCQAATGQGGWPLTVFLTPEGQPFYAGTYFPPRARYGRPGFHEVLGGIAEAWRRDRARVRAVAAEWAEWVRADLPRAVRGGGGTVGEPLVAEAVSRLAAEMDPVRGGFGGAPKFPHTEALELLLRAGGEAAELACFSLRCICRGGVQDQLGGGFHRYSVDEAWRVPHFEKMLYDNALIPQVLLSAYQRTGDAEFAAGVRATLDYLLREMRDPAGGFFSAEDADSAGPDGRPREGAFYTWTPAEVQGALRDPEQAQRACRLFGVREQGDLPDGRSVLHLEPPPPRGMGEAGGGAAAGEAARLEREAMRQRLLSVRALRPRPQRDEQVLAAWNGLALSAFARAGRILGEARYVEAARAAARFILGEMRAPAGGLLRRWFAGEAGVAGALDDYGFVCNGLIDLYEATWETRWLAAALELARQAVRRFWDPAAGAFYLVESGREDLLVRPGDQGDSGTPSAEAAAVTALLRLAAYTEDPAFRDIPAAVLARQAEAMRRHPLGLASLLAALDFAVRGPVEVVFAVPGGDWTAERQAAEWRSRLALRYLPHLVLSRWTEGALPGEKEPPPVWRGRGPVGGQATVWVCRGGVCLPPADRWEAVEAALRGGDGGPG